MELIKAIKDSFVQLTAALDQLTDQQYTTVSNHLSGATVGQHMRHIIELYQCLLNGYDAGMVCYDHRKRDVAIETSKDLAKQLLIDIFSGLDRSNKEMKLESFYGDVDSSVMSLPTNYYRELMYNLEHSVHHMALIRVGLKEFSAGPIAENFGVASSTISHKKQCAQ